MPVIKHYPDRSLAEVQINDTICLFESDGMRIYTWADGKMVPMDQMVEHPYDLSDPQLDNDGVVAFALNHVAQARNAAASRMLRLSAGKYNVSTLAMAAATLVRERCSDLAHCFIKCDDRLKFCVRSVNGTSMMSNITHDIYARETFHFLNKAVHSVARPPEIPPGTTIQVALPRSAREYLISDAALAEAREHAKDAIASFVQRKGLDALHVLLIRHPEYAEWPQIQALHR